MPTKEDEKIKKFISKRTKQSKEYGLRQDDFEEELFAFIKSYSSQKALEARRKTYESISSIHMAHDWNETSQDLKDWLTKERHDIKVIQSKQESEG